MKADFFNSVITLLLILLLIPGIIPSMVSIADGQYFNSGNSTNNTKHANLIIDKLYADPADPKPDEDVMISALVKNVGNAESEPTSIIFNIDGDEERKVVQNIKPGLFAVILHVWTAPEKEGTVIITAYLENAKNNQLKTSVSVKNPLPDLIIQSIVPEPANPLEGNPLKFTMNVKNQGTESSEASLGKYYINKDSGHDFSIPSLPAGASTNIEFSLTSDQVIGGQLEVKVVVDSGNTVLESNENNNVFTKTILVNGLPDLTLGSITLNPAAPKVGDNITFTALVKNIGYGASPTCMLKYNINWINGDYIGSGLQSIPALAAGDSKPITFLWRPTSEGNITITALVDANSNVSESSEVNNLLAITAAITNNTTNGGGEVNGSSSGSNESGSGDSGSSGSDTGSADSGSGGSGSGSSGSSGGVGGSSSKEPVENVASKELVARNVMSGNFIKYDFTKNSTCIVFVAYDAERTFLKTITLVEELKSKSSFVPTLPTGRIYKNVNIWVGNKVEGLPTSIKNGLIGFKIEKSWITDNNIDESHVTLQRFNESWEPLPTEKVGEDSNYVYFESRTPGFSSFAITEYNEEADKNLTQIGAKLQDALLGSQEIIGKATSNVSVNNSNRAQDARGAVKILMAILLPTFLIIVGYLVVKKKI